MIFYRDQSLEYHDSDRLAGMMIGMACIVLALGTPRLRQLALNGFHWHCLVNLNSIEKKLR